MADVSVKLTAGGDVQASDGTYLSRPADEQLLEACLAGEFAYILACRQIGKSSLKNAVAEHLSANGIRVARIDLNRIGHDVSHAETWYFSLMDEISRGLKLRSDLEAWWDRQRRLSTLTQRFLLFLEEIVLAEIEQPVIIFIDEIDVTLGLSFTDDFFAAIRVIHNDRSQHPHYRRLTFVLLGVATPDELINDNHRTPFNIGKSILIRDFTLDEGAILSSAIEKCHPGKGRVYFQEIYNWTSGHPYLTQKLCVAVVKSSKKSQTNLIDKLVQTLFIADLDRSDDNIRFVQKRMLSDPQAQRMLRIYQQVLEGKSIPDNKKSTAINRLKLYGLIVVKNGILKPRNRIYAKVFDMSWVSEYLSPSAWIILSLALVVDAFLAVIIYQFIHHILVIIGIFSFCLPILYFITRRWIPVVTRLPETIAVNPLRRYGRIYYQYLTYRHRDFDVRGLSTQGIFSLDLERVMVELRLAPQSIHQISENPLTPVPEVLRGGRHSIWDYLGTHQMSTQNLAIIGPPGSGKTTLLKHITLILAGDRNRIGQRKKAVKIPMLLFLRDHAQTIVEGVNISLVQIIQESLAKYSLPSISSAWFKQQLSRGKCLVMLDGLDEIADSEMRQIVVTWIERQMVVYGTNRFIVTSRPFGYRSNPLASVSVLEIQPFSYDQVSRFINNWYLQIELMSSQKADITVQLVAHEGAEDLLRRIRSISALTDLTVNPLLLTMIATIDRYRSSLPRRRVELYAEICEVFLGKHQQARGMVLDLTSAQKQRVLQPLAYFMMDHEMREIASKTALEVIEEHLSFVSPSMTPERFLEIVENTSGLLFEGENGFYSFANLIFQEYLASAHVLGQRLENTLIRHITDSWWREVILLYAAQGDATAIIEACLDEEKVSVGTLKLAIDCLDEAQQVQRQTRNKLEQILTRWIEDSGSEISRTSTEALLKIRLNKTLRVDEGTYVTASFLTNAEYQLYLEDNKNSDYPDDWKGSHFPSGYGKAPVTGIKPSDATAFCEWLTRRGSGEWIYRPLTGDEFLAYDIPITSLTAQYDHVIPHSDMVFIVKERASQSDF